MAKGSLTGSKQNEFACCKLWTTADRIWGCKKNFDHYNATPSLEAIDYQKVKR
jgi:hypothetical protein